MDDATRAPDRLATCIEKRDFDAAETVLDRVRDAAVDTRKETVRTVTVATRGGESVTPLLPSLTGFLDDDERSVRLTTAKAFVAVANAEPEGTTAAVPALAARLADDGEFYYVRARSAEALGYVAAACPDEAATPGILADLRIGLSFDEPEVREKLAKALEHVAYGDPGRLSHQVSTLAEHLDDGAELVRYHLTTALAVVGCENPATLADARDALGERLADGNPYVRGRALEALGVFARSADASLPTDERAELTADEESFVADRARFARAAAEGEGRPDDVPSEIGDPAAIRETTDGIVEDITTPDADDECPHCGLALPTDGAPLCPRCGAPR